LLIIIRSLLVVSRSFLALATLAYRSQLFPGNYDEDLVDGGHNGGFGREDGHITGRAGGGWVPAQREREQSKGKAGPQRERENTEYKPIATVP